LSLQFFDVVGLDDGKEIWSLKSHPLVEMGLTGSYFRGSRALKRQKLVVVIVCAKWTLMQLHRSVYVYMSGVPAVLTLQSCPEIVLKSQSFSTNVLILTIVVRAQ